MAKGAAAGGAGSSRLLVAEPALHRSPPLWQHKIGKMLLLPKGNSLELTFVRIEQRQQSTGGGNDSPTLNRPMKNSS